MDKNGGKKTKSYYFILLLISISLILEDWRFNSFFTFGDLTIMLSTILIIANNGARIRIKQIYLYIFVVFLVLSNILLNAIFNFDFLMKEGMIGLFKVAFYLASIILIYNFLRRNKLEFSLLEIIEKSAIVVCIIGVYIYLSLYLNEILPYEFFWKFTRTDAQSYSYAGFSNIIRMRSIFAEPAHLGVYLNLVLAISYFNKWGFSLSKKAEKIIIISLILTFSMASVVVMTTTFLLKLFKNKSFFSIIMKKSNIMVIFIIGLLAIIMWEVVDTTIISRVNSIFSGTDSSAYSRIFGSWGYVSWDNILIGNGIRNSPTLYNNLSYILSDLGLIHLIVFLIFIVILANNNIYLASAFFVINFAKGGYVGPAYWMSMMAITLYCYRNKLIDDKVATKEHKNAFKHKYSCVKE